MVILAKEEIGSGSRVNVCTKSLLLQSEADLLVAVVVASVRKIFRARRALERSFSSVHPLVSLPNVLVGELFLAELTCVQVLADVDVSVHPHIVAGGVMLSTLNTDVSLLTTRTCE